MPTLHKLLPVRNVVLRARTFWFNRFWGMSVDPTAKVSLSAKLDKTNPKGIHIGAYTTVTFGVAVLSHDLCRVAYLDTHIGKNCFIGAHSIILPGVTVGDGSIVAAGSVVRKNVPPNTIVGGNPAKIIREGIKTLRYGVLEEHYPGDPADMQPV